MKYWLLLSLLCWGCTRTPPIIVTVDDVRIMIVTANTVTPGSSGAIGAIVGGLLAGSTGAVTGYALSRTDAVTESDVIIACSVLLHDEHGRSYRLDAIKGSSYFDSTLGEPSRRCALYRQGDRIYAWLEANGLYLQDDLIARSVPSRQWTP